jgi:hypothetical protein
MWPWDNTRYFLFLNYEIMKFYFDMEFIHDRLWITGYWRRLKKDPDMLGARLLTGDIQN